MRRRLTACTAAAAIVGLILPLWAGPAQAAATPLVGVFEITAGSCAGGTVSGSYFRMILSSGNANGPFLSNNSSKCSDQTYTALSPGTQGGLVTGTYQPMPNPAFDSSGNSLAGAIIAPAAFYGVNFGASTNPIDPQTAIHVAPPAVDASGTALSGDLRAFNVSWNNQNFNQGSPKPDGTYPGITAAVSGTYDAATGDYSLQWISQIVGGPFNGFSGLWHLTGRFVASGAAPASTGAAQPPGGANTPSGSRAAPTGSGQPTASGTSSGPAGTTSTTATANGNVAGASPAGGSGARPLAVKTTLRRSGWQAPDWLVALVAGVGVLAFAALLFIDRALRGARTEGGAP